MSDKMLWLDHEHVEENNIMLQEISASLLSTTTTTTKQQDTTVANTTNCPEIVLFRLYHQPWSYPDEDGWERMIAFFTKFGAQISHAALLNLPLSRAEQILSTLTNLKTLIFHVDEKGFEALPAQNSLEALTIGLDFCEAATIQTMLQATQRCKMLKHLKIQEYRSQEALAPFMDFLPQRYPPSLNRLDIVFDLWTKESKSMLPLVTQLAKRLRHGVTLHVLVSISASVCSTSCLFRDFMSAVQASPNTSWDYCLYHGPLDKDVVWAVEHVGVKYFELHSHLHQVSSDLLRKARVETLVLACNCLSKTDALKIVENLFFNVSVRKLICEPKLPEKILHDEIEPILERNKLLAAVQRNSARLGDGTRPASLAHALCRLLQTQLGATPAYALVRRQTESVLLWMCAARPSTPSEKLARSSNKADF